MKTKLDEKNTAMVSYNIDMIWDKVIIELSHDYESLNSETKSQNSLKCIIDLTGIFKYIFFFLIKARFSCSFSLTGKNGLLREPVSIKDLNFLFPSFWEYNKRVFSTSVLCFFLIGKVAKVIM